MLELPALKIGLHGEIESFLTQVGRQVVQYQSRFPVSNCSVIEKGHLMCRSADRLILIPSSLKQIPQIIGAPMVKMIEIKRFQKSWTFVPK